MASATAKTPGRALPDPLSSVLKRCIHVGMTASWQRHGCRTSLPGPTHPASDKHLRFQARIRLHMATRRALNPYDNCITSDQNFAESMFFHTRSKSEAGLTDHCLFNLAIRSIVDKVE